jgi:hypothetical protein
VENFELIFETALDKGLQPASDIYDWRSERVIVAEDLATAKATADAMLKEEVEASEYLIRVISVRPTDKPPGVFVYDEGRHCWDRVLQNLNIHTDTIEFIYAEVGGTRERVGFKKIS